MTNPEQNDIMTWEEAVRWCLAEPQMFELARDAYFGDTVEAAQRYRASAEFAAVLKMLPSSPGRVLDLGAGNGILSWALAAGGWNVTAVEPDPSALVGAGAIRELSERTGTPINVIEAFGETIPIEEAEFDAVVARQVLHHAADLPQFCSEMARLARPGAIILTLRDHVISGPHQLRPFLDQHPLHHLYGGENAFTLQEYRGSLEQAGFKILREMRSFQSVVNYDPMSRTELLDRLSSYAGPLQRPFQAIVKHVPFSFVTSTLAAFDRRPGRLVSFLCRKADHS